MDLTGDGPLKYVPWTTIYWFNRPGDDAVDANLFTLEGENIKFQKYLDESKKAGKPLVVFAGSWTWPPFRQQVKEVHDLMAEYGDRVEWISIYLMEAHAQDVWPLGQHVCVTAHKTLEDR